MICTVPPGHYRTAHRNPTAAHPLLQHHELDERQRAMPKLVHQLAQARAWVGVRPASSFFHQPAREDRTETCAPMYIPASFSLPLRPDSSEAYKSGRRSVWVKSLR